MRCTLVLTIMILCVLTPPAFAKPKQKGNRFSISTGATYMTYRQTGFTRYSGFSVTPKIAFDIPLFSSNWSIGANGYYNAYVFHSSPSGVTAQVLGANLRAGYTLGGQRWSLSLFGGLFYSTMFVTGSRLGYTDLLYPHFYPVFRKSIKQKYWLTIYAKYVPLSENLNLSLSQRELAGGVSWSRPLRKRGSFSVGVDFSDMRLKFRSSIDVKTTSYTLSIGFGF